MPPTRSAAWRTETVGDLRQGRGFHCAFAAMPPTPLSPATAVRPDAPPRFAGVPPRPPVVAPSAIVDLRSGGRPPPIPPVLYKGFSRLPAHLATPDSAWRARPPGDASGALPATASTRSLALAGPSGCNLPVALRAPPPALQNRALPAAAGVCPAGEALSWRREGEALINFDDRLGEVAAAEWSLEDPAGPGAGVAQRMLLDEGGRMQRIIAADPAYAAMVAAFYVTTAALGARRR